MGRVEQHGLAGLDFALFQASLDSFKEKLHVFAAERIAACASLPGENDHMTQDQAPPYPLDPAALLALLGIVEQWAGFQPGTALPNTPLFIIRAKFGDIRKRPAAEAPGNAETTAAAAQETDISILNSFYAHDIAQVISGIENGVSMPVLEAYLTPLPASARVDLYQTENAAQIAGALAPAQLPRGHWLDNPKHAMSLMQQFAINTILRQLDSSGIFSVNGPPGTGKTTLLRDIFADNIVRRARVLAGFDTADKAFLPQKIKVSFRGADACTISPLREELGGFEMVVASSNNTAVENISRDLPKTSSLGEHSWRDGQGRATIGYLQPIAHNLAARNSEGDYDELKAPDMPWGLISCALGKSANRSAFKDGLIQCGPREPGKASTRFDENKHQSLWKWRTLQKGVSYAQAREELLLVDEEVRTRIAQLDHYATLYTEMQGLTMASYTHGPHTVLAQATQALANAAAAVRQYSEERQLCLVQLQRLAADDADIERTRPGWWMRLLKSAPALAYERKLAANQEQQRHCRQRQYAVEEPLLRAKQAEQLAAGAQRSAQQALANSESQWHKKQQEHNLLAKHFPLAAAPKRLDSLDDDSWQIEGLWRDELLKSRRAALFAAALQLQQAWLAEVLQTGKGFGGNIFAICHLLSGKRLDDSAHALAIWRSLFMLVPVVSTTLASFANQFRYLGANSIGWLFIDEAGQAVPQAAVGAL